MQHPSGVGGWVGTAVYDGGGLWQEGHQRAAHGGCGIPSHMSQPTSKPHPHATLRPCCRSIRHRTFYNVPPDPTLECINEALVEIRVSKDVGGEDAPGAVYPAPGSIMPAVLCVPDLLPCMQAAPACPHAHHCAPTPHTQHPHLPAAL